MRFLPYEQLFNRDRKEFHKALDKVIDSGQSILGKDLQIFEKNFAKYIGTQYAIGVNSGTDALFIAMRALGIGKGDVIFVPSMTFIASLEAIKRTGARPFLLDIGEDGLIDSNGYTDKIEPNETIKGVMPVHLEGKVCDMEPWLKLKMDFESKGKQFFIIEDAAQALGAKLGDKKVGWIGDVGCFSLYPAKILGLPGDAGMITTNNSKLYVKCQLLRNHWNIVQQGLPYKPPEELEWTGNSRLDNFLAACGNIKLKKLPLILRRREEIAKKYKKGLKALEDLGLLKLPLIQKGRVYQDYVVRCEDSKGLKEFLAKKYIGTLGVNLIPNHKYKGLGLESFDLPKTEEYLRTQIRIPCNQMMTDKEVNQVIVAIWQFFGKKI